MTLLRWILALLLAVFLIFMGLQKFGGPNPVFSYIAETTGVSLFEPVVRMMTGAGEIFAALMLVWPKTRTKGAILAAAVIGGALLFHISPFLGIDAPVAFDADGGYVKSPMLFFMAISFFIANLVLLTVEKLEASLSKPQ